MLRGRLGLVVSVWLVVACASRVERIESNRGSGAGGSSGSSGAAGSIGSTGSSGTTGFSGSSGSSGTGAASGIGGGDASVDSAPGGNGGSGAGGTAGTNGASASAGSAGTAGDAGGSPGDAGPVVRDPIVPPVSGACPEFKNSTVTLMNLAGIEIVVGPKAAGPTAPMVFYWHGTGSSSNEYTIFAPEIRDGVVGEGGVLVSFQNTTGGDILSGTSIFGEGDFAITDQLVACAVRDHNVDPRRIYVTGCSAGALFAAAMAARRSSYVAAAAANTGGWAKQVAWQNNHTPALMTVHPLGGLDQVVIDFGVTSKLAGDAFKARGGFWINCVHQGRHCAQGLGPSFWQFFEAHPFGVAPEPWSSVPAGFLSGCKIM